MSRPQLVFALALVGCGGSDSNQSRDAEESNTPANPKTVFVTDERMAGGFGGQTTADSICQSEADDAGLLGTYRAFLSTTSRSAASRLADAAYVRPDGVSVARSLADLVDGAIQNAINVNAAGQTVGGDVWTGTLQSGNQAANCADWTVGDASSSGQCGSTQFTDERWTENQVPRCDVVLRLFCFEAESP